MQKEHRLRQIAPLDLASFRKPEIPGNRSLIWQAVWYLVNALFFQSTILGLLPNSVKARMLRLFGAQVGTGLVCKPRVVIKYPWFLAIGDNVWIGEGVWIDNLCQVIIGDNVCLSQGTKVFTGSHDWSSPDFSFFARPVIIGDGVWVTAFRVLRPGVKVPPNVVVLSDLSAGSLKA